MAKRNQPTPPKWESPWFTESSFGKSAAFDNPDDLFKACLEYLEWAAKNPLVSEKIMLTRNGAVKRAPVYKMRVATLSGLVTYLGITRVAWHHYRHHKGEAFGNVVSRVDELLRVQKEEGAAAEMLNPAITARLLGLADKQEVTSPDGSMTPKTTQTIDFSKLSTEALKEIVSALDGERDEASEPDPN